MCLSVSDRAAYPSSDTSQPVRGCWVCSIAIRRTREPMRIAVLSDTHAPRFWKGCPPLVAEHLAGVDVILHAGDVCTPSVLVELSAYAPVQAVLGNNDGPDVAEWGAPPELALDLDGMSVAMVHDSGPAQGRAARLRRRFPAAELVVFGHSHIPWNVVVDGQRTFNPGSPTDRRRQPRGTMGIIVIEAGQLLSAEIVPVTVT
jgi:putative phosphoesterase